MELRLGRKRDIGLRWGVDETGVGERYRSGPKWAGDEAEMGEGSRPEVWWGRGWDERGI